ncbi:ketoacyl-ACP synthase III family protein [Burkholderia gladioli pv. gladioli]|uniref:3-Oxoacyl-[acyl-carrier-(ACP)] synthase III family protein n=1 Tax=Burkholderia gladioli TaxID=28095 RepID=A0A095F3L4_BURGA|nr:ketoacyl-ACP synthase III family protein [Burkholderia gladioli]AJW98120.1 3-Oxoacyl-[acyl-carrier-(ACP)] synthase III family protein [Burkholderia gladioli]ASD80052.1 3-oxoacyl-ACP synthase [Burkholderia gladioli pv. gladioli]AWY54700.1 3-oxoacyl-ACP synthase [Burkholderia gladioli pv. gladioli]KGC11555.1 3-Oxoacyl-[acyl-carrier-(ACP)] synthase III family protein [Burkholderia gladioli]MDJ1160338.1 ketoacyl-ACP synthase III family protein [Burkholderia gladioli pv. gladioli]
MTAPATTSMLSLSGIATSFPARTVDANTWARRCGFPEGRASALLRNGVQQFHDAAAGPPVTFACEAISTLLEDTGTTPASIDALIYTHTIRSSVLAPPAGTAAFIQSRMGLDRALAFAVMQQNCVSPMAAIRVLRVLTIAGRPIQRAIVVCADVMGSGCDHLRAIQDLALHSDGACAILLERGADRNCIVGLHLYTDGRYFRGTDDELQPVPDDRYYWSAFTTMRAALRQAGLTGNELVHVLPHHVNLPGWQRLMTMLSVPQERLFTANFARLGHVFGADPFINFHTAPRAQPGSHSLLFSSGLAGCFGAMVIRH